MSTRTKTNFPLFDYGQELRQTVLPTFEDVVKYYLLVQHNIKQERKGQQPPIAEIAELVERQLEQLSHKASIPIISHTGVVKQIRQYVEKYRSIIIN